MRLVVDTNRIIAALVKDGISRHIILHFEGELISVGFSKEELSEHKKEILEKAKIEETEFEMIMDKLFSKLTILDDKVVTSAIKEAREIMEKIDPADVPFIAAAIATESALWSNDKHFKKQDRIRILNTKELIEKIEITTKQ